VSHHINLFRIKTVAQLLDSLNESVVFIGGATVSLYADDNRAEARPTEDIDVIVEVASYNGYMELDKKLRSAGFINDIISGVICRYQVEDIIVDIMPTHPEILGFSNIWYPEGFQHAIVVDAAGVSVDIFSLPYFIASKIEAFKSRGKNDCRFSSDFEDIVYVLENNSSAETLLLTAPKNVFIYLQDEFSKLMADPEFEEGLYTHTPILNLALLLNNWKKLSTFFSG
jgi:predicted nucleotidyltransferase